MTYRKNLTDYSETDLARLMAEMEPDELERFEAARKKISPASSVLTAPDQLTTALYNSIQARKLIPKEQKKIDELIEEAQAKGDDVELQSRYYQRDLIAWQLNRCADIAEKRLTYLGNIKSPADQKKELTKIKNGVAGMLHWFEYYAWGFDPRPDSPLSVMPLAPFPFQEEYLKWLHKTIFIYRRGGLVEKSRDMGATVVTVCFDVWAWLASPGFTALLGSRKENLIDDKENMDTLFQKARFQIELLPKWQHPRGFDMRKHMGYMKISNPETKAALTGEAPTGKWGRQARATMAMGDEWAHWPDGGYPQHVSVSMTTKSVIKISSVYGKQNQFYEERHSKGANFFTMRWQEHPWKDMRWYNGLEPGFFGPPMSKELIAQEVDINYEASQPGRVWPMYSEPHTVITMSELARALHNHNIFFPDGDIARIPWSPAVLCARLNDRGATMGHRNAWLWAWRLPEHYPFSDTVFIHREWLAPIGVTFRTIVENVRAFEAPDNEGEKIVISLNSHEAESERINYAEEYDLEFEGWKTDYESGLAQVTEFLTVIEKEKENPFRVTPNGYPKLMGRTRLMIITQNGQGELQWKNQTEMFVTPGRDFAGMVNLRRQASGYHYPQEEAGKAVGQMRPAKIDDDLVDDLRALALAWADLTRRKTGEEEIADRLKKLSAGFAEPDVDNLTGWDRQARLAALNHARKRLEKELDSDTATGSALADYQSRVRKGAML